MKENMNPPKHAARHSVLWLAWFSMLAPLAYLHHMGKMIHANASISLNSKYDRGIEKQTYLTYNRLFPVIGVFKRLAYLRTMFYALLLKFNKLLNYSI